jgi:hypothetical protein
LQLELNRFTCWQVIMKYIQKGHVDDKIVSQLLQVHQTFLFTCLFLWMEFHFSSSTNQIMVFGKYINLLSALISKKWFLNRLIFFHQIKKNLFINASSICHFLLHTICCGGSLVLTFNLGCWTTERYSLVNRSIRKYSHFKWNQQLLFVK